MRCPEEKIKEALLHPDEAIRYRAVHYFSRSYSSDPSIMMLVIEGVATYGLENSFSILLEAYRLKQSEASIDWVIQELNGSQAKASDDYRSSLVNILNDADPTLTLPREKEILEARYFFDEDRWIFLDLMNKARWDEATCWREIEEYLEENSPSDEVPLDGEADEEEYEKDASVDDEGDEEEDISDEEEFDDDDEYTDEEEYDDGVDPGYLFRIVDVLAGCGGNYSKEKILPYLVKDMRSDRDPAEYWMEQIAVRLAGRLRMEEAIPSLFSKFLLDIDDYLNEETTEALSRIGTPEVLHCLAEEAPTAPDHFAYYAVNILQDIHSDLAVETCVQFLRQEKYDSNRLLYADALLEQFSLEGINEARQLLLTSKIDRERKCLRRSLIETCQIMGVSFPEMESWQNTIIKEAKELKAILLALTDESSPLSQSLMKGMLRGMLESQLKERAEQFLNESPAEYAGDIPQPHYTLSSPLKKGQNVGRNDPCPCGSGKKYKKCCLRSAGTIDSG